MKQSLLTVGIAMTLMIAWSIGRMQGQQDQSKGKVIFVSANTPPCKADPCPSYGPDSPAASVLEIAGGNAAKERIVSGAVLRFENVK